MYILKHIRSPEAPEYFGPFPDDLSAEVHALTLPGTCYILPLNPQNGYCHQDYARRIFSSHLSKTADATSCPEETLASLVEEISTVTDQVSRKTRMAAFIKLLDKNKPENPVLRSIVRSTCDHIDSTLSGKTYDKA